MTYPLYPMAYEEQFMELCNHYCCIAHDRNGSHG